MKTLVVEDDCTSREVMKKLLQPYSDVDVAANGDEAVEAVQRALDGGEPYDLICLDIMMPIMDGQEALEHIRQIEETSGICAGKGSKIIMTTALSDKRSIMRAFNSQCEGYIVKPIEKAKLLDQLRTLGILKE